MPRACCTASSSLDRTSSKVGLLRTLQSDLVGLDSAASRLSPTTHTARAAGTLPIPGLVKRDDLVTFTYWVCCAPQVCIWGMKIQPLAKHHVIATTSNRRSTSATSGAGCCSWCLASGATRTIAFRSGSGGSRTWSALASAVWCAPVRHPACCASDPHSPCCAANCSMSSIAGPTSCAWCLTACACPPAVLFDRRPASVHTNEPGTLLRTLRGGRHAGDTQACRGQL